MVMLNKEVKENIEDIVTYITSSESYIRCIDIKKQMDENKDLCEKIKEIKKLQKEYIRSNDNDIKNELDNLVNEINNIPIYVEYNNSLEEVNEMISLVKDRLNEYFYNKLNKKIEL